MKTVTVELRCSSSLFGEERQRSRQDVPTNIEGLEDRSVEGQFAMRASVLKGTNLMRCRKWEPLGVEDKLRETSRRKLRE